MYYPWYEQADLLGGYAIQSMDSIIDMCNPLW